MKLKNQSVAVSFLCLCMASASAQVYDSSSSGSASGDNDSNLTTYVENWAGLMGYDITQPPANKPTDTSTQLLNYSTVSLTELLLYSTFFGFIPTATAPNSSSSSNSSSPVVGASFVPQGNSVANMINQSSNTTFGNYSNINQATDVTANALVDQVPYQSDPVSQALLNILGTPDVSYCTTVNSNGITLVTNPTNPNTTPASCSTLGSTMFQNQVIENVIGTLPDQASFYTFNTNQELIAQLNSNTLLAPLIYSTDNSSSTSNNSDSGTPGLQAQSQLQQASNFIRYVSGSVLPTILPNLTAYQTLYNQAIAPNTNNPAGQAQAQAVLSTYLTSLRVYAAQTSVGMSNLYYILSKRMPQHKQMPSGAQGGNGQSLSASPSQSFNEYMMATWRIFNPEAAANAANSSDNSGNNQSKMQSTQWIDQINHATPATVQKEIAILLSEINYQLYLSRQIQERMLLTSSVALLQSTKATQPSSNFSNQIISASSSLPSTSN
ncbi:MAG: hypothetical protein CK426_06915 [Legionella sp.]|nr:MAG: hypothetical protein CK423_02775 [Legionella sp.]PJD98072.1 MAG: hypothetical protein CK426_06915 [Legionella sp.]